MSSMVSSSTVAVVASSAMAETVALLAVLAFLILLVQKEAVSTAQAGWARALGRGLNLALLPLAFAFVLIAGVRLLP